MLGEECKRIILDLNLPDGSGTELLRQIRDETGCALLVIEHDMPLIAAVSDRMVALDQGQVIASGTPDDVLESPAVVASYLGTDRAAIERSGRVATGTGS